MRHIQIGSMVLAKGEQMVRKVLAIKDDHARLESVEGASGRRWFSLSQLSLKPRDEPLKLHLL